MIQVAVKILIEKDFLSTTWIVVVAFCRAFGISNSLHYNPIASAFSFMFFTLGVHNTSGVS